MLKVFSIRKRICQPGGRLFSNPINVSFLLSESFFIRILANAGGTFGKPNWLKNVQREILAIKESLGIIDMSSQSVFKLTVSS